MASPTTRRDFLKTTAAASAGFWVAGQDDISAQQQPPVQAAAGERVNVAAIGAGGRGADDIRGVLATGQANLVALCDVDDARAAPTYRQHPSVPRWYDFRAMLERQRDIDAVIVATPDHMHCHAAVMAMRLGKHVYCEKPLTHDIWEARKMKEVAQTARVATQMGNQGTAGNDFRRAVEVVQSGALGDVREVHIWTNRPIWPQNINRPTGTPEVPTTLDWDRWLGPAPQRPYNAAYLPFNWRGWWDFGTGAIGDMACHTMNLPFMALKLGYPTSVVAELTTPLNSETAPEGAKVTYEFPQRGNLPALTLYWYERRRPPEALLMGQRFTNSGSIMVGSAGSMLTTDDYGARNTLLPVNQFQGFQNPQPTLPRSPGHYREWIDAIRGGRPAMSNFVDYAALLAEVALLGNLAMRMNGQRVVWNAETMTAVDLPAANPFIHREYRRGWDL
jgi:predicted dehydrogenase